MWHKAYVLSITSSCPSFSCFRVTKNWKTKSSIVLNVLLFLYALCVLNSKQLRDLLDTTIMPFILLLFYLSDECCNELWSNPQFFVLQCKHMLFTFFKFTRFPQIQILPTCLSAWVRHRFFSKSLSSFFLFFKDWLAKTGKQLDPIKFFEKRKTKKGKKGILLKKTSKNSLRRVADLVLPLIGFVIAGIGHGAGAPHRGSEPERRNRTKP